MRIFFILLFHLLLLQQIRAQRYKIELHTGSVYLTDRMIIVDDLFRSMPFIAWDNKKIRLDAVKEVTDAEQKLVYKTMKFRKRVELARLLELGNIYLFDLHSPDRRESLNNRQISSNGRFYFNRKGDSVLNVLKRKNFDKVFDSSFVAGYPGYQKIKKDYLRLHTAGVFSLVMLPNMITVIGFQSLGLLIPYTAATIFMTANAVIKRQIKFQKVRQMVRDYNSTVF